MGGYVLPTQIEEPNYSTVVGSGSGPLGQFGSHDLSPSFEIKYLFRRLYTSIPSPCYTTELTPGEQIRDRKIPRSQLFYSLVCVHCAAAHTHTYFLWDLTYNSIYVYTQARQRCVFKKINMLYSIKDLFVT